MLRRTLILLAFLFPSIALAQGTGPTLTEITEAWLASPHADRSSAAFSHWNEDGEIPGTCAVCHSSIGLLGYLGSPMDDVGAVSAAVPTGTVIECTACHNQAAVDLANLPFPSGVDLQLGRGTAICAVCHQGRASTDTVNAAVTGIGPDVVAPDLGFVNSHYAVAAATGQGGAARGGYEYPDRVYSGPFTHVPGADTCSACHSPHSLQVEFSGCAICHEGATEAGAIRTSPVDFDGDGETSEGIADPIATLHERLAEAIALYASEVAEAPIIYAAGTYPYFFNDTDGNGAVSEGEAAYPNRYRSWTPRLLRAAYNYQFVRQDRGAYAHNPHYVLQLLHDSLADLGEAVEVDISAYTRP